ncbi:TetR/AcrR family transcriptional regulator [Paenibacillus sp. YIM B09110]|uniref:TetR/AcrR family transcriptional regulator n=1 Tax=Paenibacillus sp. YIM B09110 TaxID=3126102 RepID=UPI00301CED7E
MQVSKPKLDRRIVRSKEALKQALLSLMMKKKFSSISITEIVEHVNYNRGTFYAHYDNKEALLDDIVNELMDEFKQAYRSPYEQVEVFHVAEMSANAIKIFEHIHARASTYSALMNNDVLHILKDKMYRVLQQLFIMDMEQINKDINQELLIVYSVSSLHGLIFYWIENGFPFSPVYMQEQLHKLINSPVMTSPIHMSRPELRLR